MPIGKRIEIDYDRVYHSRTGDFKIVKELPSVAMGTTGKAIRRMVEVEFIETGTRKQTQLQTALAGKVLDPYYKTAGGVGYLGDISNLQYTKNEYDIWRHMILRCYDPNDNAYYNYGAIGIKVDERWHCFANFVRDLPLIYGYADYYNSKDKSKFALDKDILQRNIPREQRIYSVNTCVFAKSCDNSRMSRVTDKSKTSSNYYGVYRNKNGSYQSSINVDKKKYFLGTYDDEVAAATVYNYVISRCSYAPTLNTDLPTMDINEALSHRLSNVPLVLPPNIDTAGLNLNPNNGNKYIGVAQSSYNSYAASYSLNNRSIHIGVFDSPIAAANAHNWCSGFYANGNGYINDVPYMPPTEWLHHKKYRTPPVEMCKIVNK
jgi:hypothetical protein